MKVLFIFYILTDFFHLSYQLLREEEGGREGEGEGGRKKEREKEREGERANYGIICVPL
jgi:hypothetical protein